MLSFPKEDFTDLVNSRPQQYMKGIGAPADPIKATEIIRKLLDWDASSRIKRSEALLLPYFETS
jgi:hypothetical protein